MKILFDNKIESASLSDINGDENYPLSNLEHPFLRKRWQSASQSDTITALFTSQNIDDVFVGYKNRDATVKVYESCCNQYTVSEKITGDIGSINTGGIVSDRIDIDIKDELLLNGEFHDGSTDWMLETVARVRKQGYVMSIFGATAPETTTPSPAVNGDTFYLKFAARRAAINATSLRAYIRITGGTPIAVGVTDVTAADGTDWVIKTVTGTISKADASGAEIVLQANGYTSGTGYFGFAYGTINGVPIMTNWDFSDSTLEWSQISTALIQYDVANAYMGNALIGGSQNILHLQATTITKYPRTITAFPVVYGETYTFGMELKTFFAGAGAPLFYLVWLNSLGAQVGTTSFAPPATGYADYTNINQSGAVPVGAVSCKFQATIDSNDGLWFVGRVSVEKVVTDKAYLGGIGFGVPYAMKPPSSFWEEGFDDRSIVSESDSGQVLQEYIEPLKFYNWTFETMDRTTTRAFQYLYAMSGKGHPLWIDPDTDALDEIYGRIVEAIQTTKDKRRYTTKMTIKEAR